MCDYKAILRGICFGFTGVLPFVAHASISTAICAAVAIVCCFVINWIFDDMWFKQPRKWSWLTLIAVRLVVYGLPFLSAYFIYLQHGILFWGNAELEFSKTDTVLMAVMLLVITLPSIVISDIQSDAGFGKHPFHKRKKRKSLQDKDKERCT